MNTVRLEALNAEQRRKEIEKEKSARQAQQAKLAEKERLSNEAAAIAAVSEENCALVLERRL